MTTISITGAPLHSGRISPMLHGGFIELLDDLVPGMWAEMLNNRSFEGVESPSGWCYYNGAPNLCDREWERSDTWSLDPTDPFNGTRSARLEARKGAKASLAQSGLAVRSGMTYRFEGWFRADARGLRPRVLLKARNPDGSIAVLGSADLSRPSADWSRQEREMTSSGTTDRAAFEIEVAGSGNFWADKLSLMPADNVRGWRADVTAAVKAARPALLRWGGSVVDPGGYQWKIGIGSRDARTPFRNQPWGRIDSNDVGLDEFLQFCRLVDAAALICVSFSDGPQSAKDLVAYCNAGLDTEWGARRAANGHPEPYGVRYWQVGNELGDERYVKGCAAICRAIREVDPAAVILSSYPSPELLAEAGRYLDYACPHHYDPDLKSHEASIDQTVDVIRKASLDHEVKIGITEWNVTGGWWGNGRGRLLTLEAALYAGRYLNLLHRRSDVVALACRSNMTNSFGSGMIQTNASGLLLTPGYHVMKLYASHSRPVPLSAAVAGGAVDVSACASEDGTRLTVFLVNPTVEPIEITLDDEAFRTGFRPVTGEVVCDTRDMRQPDLMNHFAAPDRVRTMALSVQEPGIRLPAFSAAAIECEARPGERR